MRQLAALLLASIAAVAGRLPHVAAQAPPAVAEIVNESRTGVRFTVLREGVRPREYHLEPRGETQIAAAGAVLELAGGRIALAGDVRYAFRENAKGQVTLATVGRRAAAKPRPAPGRDTPKSPPQAASLPPLLPTNPQPAPPARTPSIPSPPVPSPTAPMPPVVPSVGGELMPAVPGPGPRQASRVATIAVKVCVDDEEAARDEIWQKRLRERFAAASEITEKTAGVRFAPVAFARWDTDDAQHDFARSLREFEQKVDAGAARLVVGFASQYEIPRGETHLGGTRGPLHAHILIREWSRHIAEPERLEVLTHELGHYLGAVHSGDASSVMRPKLGDKRSRSVKFEIRFDDANAQIVRLLGDEMRLRPVRRLADLSDRTKAELLKRYDALAQANPKDPAVKHHIALVEQAGGRR